MSPRYLLLIAFLWVSPLLAAEPPAVSFKEDAGKLEVLVGGQPFATYVYQDDKIPRPFFRHLRAPGGVQVTRNQPPAAGDLTDHATFHPGVWLAFGDLSGQDYWRTKARVKHERFVNEAKGAAGSGSFTVLNHYLGKDDTVVCRETCRCTIAVRPAGILLRCESEFVSDTDFSFGDQEEMGFGVRVATPLNVGKGGRITNSDGLVNEPKAWGKQADWCDYSGVIDGRRVGILLMPSPDNFGRSWFHVRDYGLMVANPFGRSSFRAGAKSQVVVKKGEKLALSFALLVYSAPADKPPDLAAAYADCLEHLKKR